MSISSINNTALQQLLTNYTNTSSSISNDSTENTLALLLGTDSSSVSSFASLLSNSTSTTTTSDLLAARKELMTQKSNATSEQQLTTIQSQLDAVNEQLAEALANYEATDYSSLYSYDTSSYYDTSSSDDTTSDLMSYAMQSLNLNVLQALGTAQQQLKTREAAIQKTVDEDGGNTTANEQLEKVQENLNVINSSYSTLLSTFTSTNTNSSSTSSSLLDALNASSALQQYETTNA